MDTQNYFNQLGSRFADFRKRNFLCDTILNVGRVREFRVHSFILAAASPFFERILRNYEKAEMRHIKVPTLDPESMTIILDYIYTGKLFLPFNEEIQALHVPESLIGTFTQLGIELQQVDGHANLIAYKREEDDVFPYTEIKMEEENFVEAAEHELSHLMIEGNQYSEQMPATDYQTDLTNTYETTQQYYNENTLKVEQISSDSKPVMCGECGLLFQGMDEKLEHWRQAHIEKSCLCTFCGDQFSEEKELVQHLKANHSEEVGGSNSSQFSCDSCKRSYSSRTALTMHACMSSKQKQFNCALCNRSFQYKSQLISHLKSHTGERPYVCDRCKKSFSASLNLRQHMRTHTGERPFNCDKCEKTFTQRSHLLTHNRTHTGEKPFVCPCENCEKSYKNRLDLRLHCLKKHQLNIKLREANHPNCWKKC